jgi:prolipoprotein diacylglyceryltransferase
MLWLSLAGAERFAVEFLRAKDDRFLGPLTLAQAISLAIIAVGIAGTVKLMDRQRPSPEPGSG